MLPLFFCEQGPTPPNGNNGGVAIRRANVFTDGWTATAYIGGTNLGSVTLTRMADAYQRALILLVGAWVNTFINDGDPDN